MGAVYIPDVPDAHNHMMTAEEIRKMAYDFSKSNKLGKVDVMHDNETYGCFVVETFLSRKGDPDFDVEGTWVAAVHIPDPLLWGLVEKGELNGFSMEVLARGDDVDMEITLPAVLVGPTFKSDDGHQHSFEVAYDDKGTFIGGRTDAVADSSGIVHYHVIKRGTATEKSSGHSHRFSHVDGLLVAESPR